MRKDCLLRAGNLLAPVMGEWGIGVGLRRLCKVEKTEDGCLGMSARRAGSGVLCWNSSYLGEGFYHAFRSRR